VLVRNPDWWGLGYYPHNIDRIIWTPEPDAGRRLAMLLNDQVDFLQDPPLDQLNRLHGMPGIKLEQANSLLTILLGFNQGKAELATSDVKGHNPFADRRVREAIYRGIDVERLIQRALGGLAVPAGMVEAPGVNGYEPELDRRLPYDAERAKALLAEAGYPDGFSVRLDCLELRREPCPELTAQLARLGLRVTLEVEPLEQFKQRMATRTADFYLLGEGSGFTLDSAEPLRELFDSRHSIWLAGSGYANPTFDALLDAIDAELSTVVRDALIEQAWRIVLDDIVVVPLYRPLRVWAMRDRFDMPSGPQFWPLFRQARLTSPGPK
jgi:peptide/nickel transport system substrate-binding protein